MSIIFPDSTASSKLSCWDAENLCISSKNKQIRPDWLVCKINSLISFTPEDMALKF